MGATTTLQTIQPADGLTCPGGEVILTCTVTSVPQADTVPPTLYWEQLGADHAQVSYSGGAPVTAPLGDFNTIAVFNNANYKIHSNATLKGALLNHNQRSISCFSPPESRRTETVMVAGNKQHELFVWRVWGMHNIYSVLLIKVQRILHQD